MASLCVLLPFLPIRVFNHSCSTSLLSFNPTVPKCHHNCQTIWPSKCENRFNTLKRCQISPSDEIEGDSESSVEVLRVPHHWLEPSIALQESEWLRVALHKWLDDEYCPEPTNVDISRVAADSYYRSLLQKTTDVGEILLKMIRELETISYQESFHGAFSSANAAVSLIVQRVEQD